MEGANNNGMNSFSFINDGSYLERFKLQEQKDAAKAEGFSSVSPSADALKSSLTTKKASLLPSGLKSTAVSGGKLAFSLKSKSRAIVNPLKLGEDDDEDEDGQQPAADPHSRSVKSNGSSPHVTFTDTRLAGVKMKTHAMASSSQSLTLGLAASMLSKLLSPDYAKLAFSLPPSSSTIWSLLIDDIHAIAEEEGEPCTRNKEEILAFVGRFFSSQVVERLGSNLTLLSGSCLGLNYTYRHGKALFTRTIVHDIVDRYVCRESSDLYNFLGVCDGHISETLKEKVILIIDTSHMASKALGEGETYTSKDGGGGGGGGSGGQGVEKIASSKKLLNDSVETIDVWMPSFTTPPRKSKGRGDMLAHRSLLFEDHECVAQGAIYDPNILGSDQRDVFLYHGTRTSSLKGFQDEGILPKLRPNEFSRREAFYVSNALRQAFEHPLHKNASQTLNPVSVIVFKVDASILHGDEPPSPNEKPFDVMRFPESDKEWAEFCINNLRERGMPHECDLVIGPICLPFSDMTGASALHIPLHSGARVTQVAFCSVRSRRWLQSCAVKVFCEKRKKEEP